MTASPPPVSTEATRQAEVTRATTHGRCACGEPYMPGDLVWRVQTAIFCSPHCASGKSPVQK